MIGSVRGLAIAWAVALALVIVALRDRRPPQAPVDRALWPGFDAEAVVALAWERAGQPEVRATRGGAGWRLEGAADVADAPADPGAIADVLAALRGARWHRLAAAPPARATLWVTTSAGRRALGLGPALAGASQAWIIDGERGALVDGWVARALDRDRLALSIRAPLAGAAAAQGISISRANPPAVIRIEGAAIRRLEPPGLTLAEAPARALERALAAVALVALEPRPAPGSGGVAAPRAPRLTIRLETGTGAARAVVELAIGEACARAADLVAVWGSHGAGCVQRDAVDALAARVDGLLGPPEALVERRPAPREPRQVALVDGATLDVSALRVAGAAADPARVAELVAALSLPAEVVPRPSSAASRQIAVTAATGEVHPLALYGDGVVARADEPIALRLAPGAWRALTRAARELRDPVLWREEPTTITGLQIDSARYVRGAVIGEWRREPAGAADAAALEALATALAAPRAEPGTPPGSLPSPRRRVVVTVAPPARASVERSLELGGGTAAGCPARIAGELVWLAPPVCAQVAALAR